MKKFLSLLVLIIIWTKPASAEIDFFAVVEGKGNNEKYVYFWPNREDENSHYYKIYKNENPKLYNYFLKLKNDKKGPRIKKKHFLKRVDKYNVVLKLLPPHVPKYKLGFQNKKIHNLETINIYLNFYIVDFSNFDGKIQKKKLTKFLKNNNFKTITTKDDILEDVKIANNLWNEAGLTFFTEKEDIKFIKPMVSSLQKDMIWMEENCQTHQSCLAKPKKKSELATSNYVKQHKIYRKITNSEKNYSSSGLNIYYLPRMLSSKNCGIASTLVIKNRNWNDYRKNKFYVVIGHECSNHIRGKTLAHEIGHIFGLKHEKEKDNLMYPYVSGGNKITPGQSVNSRLYYKKYGRR